VKRRAFIAGLGSAAAWPLATRVQGQERVRRVAALMAWAESDPGYRSWFNIFVQSLSQLGWTDAKACELNSVGRMAKSIECDHSLANWFSFGLT
jgi:putative tryptophan/tyrosine transport system substrate-binding protein